MNVLLECARDTTHIADRQNITLTIDLSFYGRYLFGCHGNYTSVVLGDWDLSNGAPSSPNFVGSLPYSS